MPFTISEMDKPIQMIRDSIRIDPDHHSQRPSRNRDNSVDFLLLLSGCERLLKEIA